MDGVVPSSPSLSSDNTDSDGVNTSSAKIYFGQFTSSEKKLAALVDSVSSHDPNPSSLRCSPRLSASPQRTDGESEAIGQSEQEDEDGEDASKANKRREIRGGSWQDAPFPEFLRKDEPSSAIASRIMRAHDNPSPPPKALRPTLTPRSSSKLAAEPVFPSITSSTESSDAAVESLLQSGNDYRDTPTPPPLDSSDLSRLPTPTIQRLSSRSPTPHRTSNPSPPQGPQVDTEADLISFDRSVLISSSLNDVEIHSPSPRHAQQQTVDDLLFSSPLQPASSKDEPRIITQGGVHTSNDEDSLLVNLESQAQGNSFEMPEKDDKIPDANCIADMPDMTSRWFGEVGYPEVDAAEIQKTPVAHLQVSDPSPVLRRSPRLSALSLPASQDTLRLSTPCRTPNTNSPHTDSSQIRKRRRDSSAKASRMSLSPRKSSWNIESDGSGSETELSQSPSKGGIRERKRVKKSVEGSSDAADTRLAESLSPGSARILTSLVSSDQCASSTQVSVDGAPTTPHRPGVAALTEGKEILSPTRFSAPPSPSSVQRPLPGMFPCHTLTPAYGSSVTRSLMAPNSPVKLTLAPAPNDSNRTPARRIPIKDANNTVRANYSSAGQPNGVRVFSNIARTPVFSRPPPADNPDRSPARRVPISEHPPNETTSRLKDTKASHVSAIDPPTPKVIMAGSMSKGGIANAASFKTTLPGPSSKRVFLAPAKAPIASNSSNPISKAESRIPRPGTATKPSTKRTSKLPMPSARKPNSTTTLPSRLPSPTKASVTKVPQLHNSSSSSSDDSGGGQPCGSGPESTRMLNSCIAKRKREVEKPAAARPMVKIRQVVRGMYGGPVKPIALNGTEKPQEKQHPPSSPVRSVVQPRPIKAREVVKGTLQDFELKTSSFKSLEALSEARARERAELEKANKEAQKEPSPPAPCLEAFTFECAVPEREDERMDVDSEAVTATTLDSVPPSNDAIDMERVSQPDKVLPVDSGSRRSSRARRHVSTDVFGTVPAIGSTTQSGSRRKSGTGSTKPRASSLPPNLVFSTNGLALKTLTNNNTARNQNYHAQLETHVIRKAGERPESPTMKLRTILEKQKEDQDKMRAERARRRRGPYASNEDSDVEMEESIERQQPSKHRRGPGDEEDYETPVRSNDGRKAVKWDRGLEMSVFLDEIEVQPRKYHVGEGAVPRKGCLSTASNQRVPLDGLGNPLNANAPLELVPEKVVVTKYVYDNDEEAPMFAPPSAKTTRSKTKKK